MPQMEALLPTFENRYLAVALHAANAALHRCMPLHDHVSHRLDSHADWTLTGLAGSPVCHHLYLHHFHGRDRAHVPLLMQHRWQNSRSHGHTNIKPDLHATCGHTGMPLHHPVATRPSPVCLFIQRRRVPGDVDTAIGGVVYISKAGGFASGLHPVVCIRSANRVLAADSPIISGLPRRNRARGAQATTPRTSRGACSACGA